MTNSLLKAVKGRVVPSRNIHILINVNLYERVLRLLSSQGGFYLLNS